VEKIYLLLLTIFLIAWWFNREVSLFNRKRRRALTIKTNLNQVTKDSELRVESDTANDLNRQLNHNQSRHGELISIVVKKGKIVERKYLNKEGRIKRLR